MAKLKKDFEASGGVWKEWKFSKLFSLLKGRRKLCKLDLVDCANIPVFSSDTTNNGIVGYTNLEPDYCVNNDIPVYLVFGDHTRTMNIVHKDFCVMDNVKVLIPKTDSDKILQYITSAWQKSIPNMGYARHWSYAERAQILLPTKSNQPAYDYMERYISLLENEKMLQVDKFLENSILNDPTLTAEETAALEKFRKGKVKFKEWKIGELFDIHPTKAYKMTNPDLFMNKGYTPVVTNSSVDNGITGYVDLNPTEKSGIVTYSDTTTDEGIFYQPYDFVGYSHVQGIYPFMPENWNEKTLLYFVSLFKKSAKGRFDYASKFNRAIAKEMLVSFPVADSNEIDYDFMHHFISAQEKLAIKGVVKYKDEMLNANLRPYSYSFDSYYLAAESQEEYGKHDM